MITSPVPAAGLLDLDPVRPSEAFADLLDHALSDLPDLIAEAEAPAVSVPLPAAGFGEIGAGGLGEIDLPARLDLLAALLAGPASDFIAQDMLAHCWPAGRTTTSRAALAVALRLAESFGRADRLPMACLKAWRLLDPAAFRPALVHRLAVLCLEINPVEGTEGPARLPLDHDELDLIELLFETLDPGAEIEVLARVMDFEELGDRRLALLRRIPVRAVERIEAVDPPGRAVLVPGLLQSRALLDHFSQTLRDPTLAQAARHALGELDRLIVAAGSTRSIIGDSP